jgi:translation initiation factor IF-3
VKEVQLSPRIDPHDLGIKLTHAIDFLCEDMKVKVALKFRGRENAHTEVGFEVIRKFIADIAPYGHPDFQPKLVGKAINLMISPLPRNKRAKNPHAVENEDNQDENVPEKIKPVKSSAPSAPAKEKIPVAVEPQSNGLNDAFAKLEIK